MTKILTFLMLAVSCTQAAASGASDTEPATTGWREVFSVGHPGGTDVVFGRDVFPTPEECRRSLASRSEGSDLGSSWGRVVSTCLEADAATRPVDRFRLRSLTEPR